MTEIQEVIALPSGYQRDLQATKGPLIRAFEHGLAALGLVPGLVASLEFNRERMREAVGADTHATDIAIEKARAGKPFREAYREPPTADDLAERTPEKSVAGRVSPGACADLRLAELRRRLTNLPVPS